MPRLAAPAVASPGGGCSASVLSRSISSASSDAMNPLITTCSHVETAQHEVRGMAKTAIHPHHLLCHLCQLLMILRQIW